MRVIADRLCGQLAWWTLSVVLSLTVCLGATFSLGDCAGITELHRRLLSHSSYWLVIASLLMAACIKYSNELIKGAGARTRIGVGIFTFIVSMSLIIPGSWSDEETSARTLYPWYADVSLNQMDKFTLCLMLFKVLSLALIIFVFVFVIAKTAKLLMLRDMGNVWRPLTQVGDFCQLTPVRVLTISCVVFLTWIPMLIINGPVCLPMDTMVQLIQVRGFPAWDPMMMTGLTGYALTDHHPFFDSYIYGAFDLLGMRLGNEELGLVIYIYLWSFFCVTALVTSICWAKLRSTLPKWGIGLALIFVSFVPCFSSYMSIIMKDTTWIPFYVFWLTMYFELAYQLSHSMVPSGRLRALFILCMIFSGLTKKTAIYISALSLIPFLVFKKKGLKFVAGGLASAAVVMALIPIFLFPLLKIAPGGGQEMLGTPIQQIAYTTSLENQPFSETELEVIERVVDLDKAIGSLSLGTVDPAKQAYKTGCTSADKLAFIVVWIKGAIRYPVDYVKAVPFLRNYLLVGPTYYTNGAVKYGWEESGGWAILPQYADGELSWTQEHISVPLITFLNSTAPFNLISAEAIYVLWIPVFVFACIFVSKKWEVLIYMVPACCNYLSMLFLPTYQTRYTIAFLFAFALHLSVPFVLKGASVSRGKG